MRGGRMVGRLALVVGFGIAPSTIAAQDNVVRGVVTDSAGAPVERVDITLVELGRRTLTDADGQFTLGQVPPGQYTVVATGPGFHPVARKLRVPLTEPLILRLRAGPAALRVRNLPTTEYRDYLSRYKTFAFNPGHDVSLRVG